MKQFNFRNDYSQVAHPKMLQALSAIGLEPNTGYGLDTYSDDAKSLIQKMLPVEADIHFLIGGTSANKIMISHMLKPYQAVISATTGHINVHETGAIEATGHKVLSIVAKDGKLTPELVTKVYSEHVDEHMVMPKLVYISQATELGTVYSKQELKALYDTCQKFGLYLYIDGARLGVALMTENNDLTLGDIAKLSDAFTIGGTKNGMMIGEALIITNPKFRDAMRFTIKREAGLLAKGFVIGIQYGTAFKDNLFWDLAKHANEMSLRLKKGLEKLNIRLLIDSPTNQQFLILANPLAEKIAKVCDFEEWGPFDENQKVIRFVTSWATKAEEVDGILSWLKQQKEGN